MSKCTECNEYDKEKSYCPKWCEVIKGTIEDARAEERKAIFDELYIKLMNENEETIIKWCQDNLLRNRRRK